MLNRVDSVSALAELWILAHVDRHEVLPLEVQGFQRALVLPIPLDRVRGGSRPSTPPPNVYTPGAQSGFSGSQGGSQGFQGSQGYQPSKPSIPSYKPPSFPSSPNLRGPSTSPSGLGGTDGYDYYTCSNCSKTVGANDKSCPHCGARFMNVSSDGSVSPGLSSGAGVVVFGGILVVLVVVVVIALIIGLVIKLASSGNTSPRYRPQGYTPAPNRPNNPYARSHNHPQNPYKNS